VRRRDLLGQVAHQLDELDAHALVHQHGGAVRGALVDAGHRRALGFGLDAQAEQREEFAPRLRVVGVAEHQRVADERVARNQQARQQRVVDALEVDAEQRGQRAPQAEVFEHDDATLARRAAGGDVNGARETTARDAALGHGIVGRDIERASEVAAGPSQPLQHRRIGEPSAPP
jgi:hypothetical protein